MKIRKIARHNISIGNYPVCHLCGKPITKQEEFSLDHLIPKSQGGKTTTSNLKPAHRFCNMKRGSMPLSEWFKRQQKERD